MELVRPRKGYVIRIDSVPLTYGSTRKAVSF